MGRDRPADRPAFPPESNAWPLPVLEVAPGTLLFRLNLARYRDPAYFGRRTAYRFDAPDRSYGVCYLGTPLECCILEVLCPDRELESGRRFLTTSQLRDYYAARVKVARVNVSAVSGRISILDFHYLIATPQGVEHFTERHELGLFERQEHLDAFHAADLSVMHDPNGLTGRGLYIGVRSTA